VITQRIGKVLRQLIFEDADELCRILDDEVAQAAL
jgi:hypothetical protein